MYNLLKVNVDRETDKGTILLKRVVTFGIQGKFLYASIFKDEHPSSSVIITWIIFWFYGSIVYKCGLYRGRRVLPFMDVFLFF